MSSVTPTLKTIQWFKQVTLWLLVLRSPSSTNRGEREVLDFPLYHVTGCPASIKFKDHMKNVKSKNLEIRLRFKGTQTIDLP